MALSRSVLRIIDANLNRIGEGLRLLEDVARLIFDDSSLTERLKVMRHNLLSSDISFQHQLIEARDASHDVGINLESEVKKRDLAELVVANARRVQEALRVMEELTKLSEIKANLKSDIFKEARFDLYTIEQTLFTKLTNGKNKGKERNN